ncbi:hypothetical protein [Flindersiella endophytica]
MTPKTQLKTQQAVVFSALALTLAITTTACAQARQAVQSTQAAQAAQAETTIHVGTTPIAEPVPDQIVGANHRWPDDGLGTWDSGNDRPVQRIVDLARQTNLKLVRYPGGTVANLFQWKRAIGPQAERGCQVGGGFVGSAQPYDSRFGPDEHQRLVEAMGAGTTIMTNATTQTTQDAADFVEYLNAEVGANPNGGKDWAAVRAANGHPEPYGIKVWELGNELYLGNQVYWRSTDATERMRQYALGGQQRQVDQPVSKGCDQRDSAGVSDGEAGQRFQVRYPPVVAGSQTLRVGGTRWQPVADLASAGPDAPVYTFDPKSGAVVFGDGTHGRIPPQGTEIRADYISGPHPGFVDYYAAMKQADPSIDICSAWEKPEFVQLMGKQRPYDCIGPHLYANPDVGGEPDRIHDLEMPLVDNVLGELTNLGAAIDEYGPTERKPYLEVSEYGAIAKGGTGPAPAGWAGGMSTTLLHAGLVIGMLEHDVPLAVSSNLNGAQPTAGELFGGAPDFLDTARARMLRIVGDLVGTRPVESSIVGNPRGDGDFDALRVLSTRADDGTIRLLVLNRDRDTGVTSTVALPSQGSGNVTVRTLKGDSLTSYNSAENPDAISVSTTTEPRTGTGFSHTFPAHSITMVEVPATPTIDVDPDDVIGPVSRELTGSNNDQWFGNAHGLWDPEANAPNPAVVDKVVRAGVGMLRFPGGTPANLYDWKQAIGPVEDRGCQTDGRDKGGAGSLDSTYGPDEYMEVIQATGATAEIMVPMANESPADAADWVEYFNAPVGTNPRGGVAWASKRAANGHPGPYGVKYWEIGNEPDRGGQEYWRAVGDPEKKLRQYTFGGEQQQTGQNLARGCDRRPAASTSTGEPGQRLEVLYPPVVKGSQTVKVGGDEWQAVRDLSATGPDAKAYTFDARTGQVRFGDGVHGAIPPQEQAVTADYVSGPHPGFVDFYRELKKADPSIDVCSSWAPIREQTGLGTASFARLMAQHGLADDYDCVVMHPYTSFGQDFGADDWVSARDGHDEYMLGEEKGRRLVAGLQAEVARYSKGDAYVAVSEFGALWFGGLGQHPAYPHWETSMSHVAYMASQWVNFTQLGLPWAEGNTLISEAPTGLRAVLGGPTEYVFTADATAREQLKPVLAAGGTTVRTNASGDPQLAPEQPKPGWGTYGALASSASVGDDGVLRIVVVNRHPTEALTARIAPEGFAHKENVALTTVAGSSFTDYNSSEQPDHIQVADSTLTTGTGEFDYAFPAASVTVLELEPAEGKS